MEMFLKSLGLVLVMNLLAAQSNGADSSSFGIGFYEGKCSNQRQGLFEVFKGRSPPPVDVERVVSDIVAKRFASDKTIAAALLRLQFHDCFVNGCDASILLAGDGTEQTAAPNLSVRGYDLIKEIKDELESMCPEVVSCADIIAMATRDAIFLATPTDSSGFRPKLKVETGRRDGTDSRASNVVDLPPPTASVSDSLRLFAKKNLNATDLVYLLGGGHSVGVTHCRFIQDRLFNFRNTGIPDGSMNQTLAEELRRYCANNANAPINLDLGTPSLFDNSLYQQALFFNRGIFTGDQELTFHSETRQTVAAIAKGSYKDFVVNFGKSLQKMQAVGVLTGSKGEIRKTCSVRR